MPELDAAAFLDIATRLADAAGAVSMRYFRRHGAVDDKADESPVTIADREAEAAMRAILADTVPDHGILGEEHGRERLDAEYVWVLDPIDGTKSFVTGKPLFGNLIGLVRGGRPILGVVNMPALGDRWVGCAGRPTTFNGAAVKARACADIANAWLCATSPFMSGAAETAAFERVRQRAKHAVFGGDCYVYGLVANGSVDLVVESGLKPYDFCALVPVIEGAGGLFTDWKGRPLRIDSDGRVAAAGDRRILDAALALINGG